MANIELDGANKKIKVDSGDLTLDIPGDIILDADGANVTFKDGGTSILDISNSSSDAVITSSVQDKDIIFKGDDGGSAITALTLDMSDAGAATFNGAITGGGLLTTGGNIVIPNAGNIGSASDTDAIAIASNGAVTFSQTPVFPDGSIAVADLDIAGATDIGEAIVDADLFIIDNGAGGTNRKTAASRLKTYIGGGLWDEIGVVTADNSDSNLVVTGMNDSDYEVFMGVMNHMTPGNDGVNLTMQLVNASNSAFSTHNYASVGLGDDGGDANHSGGAGTPICAGSVGSAANEDGVSGMVWITRPHLSKMITVNWNLGYTKDNGNHAVSCGGFSLVSTGGPANGLRFAVSGGNLESGTFKLYGLKA